MKISGRNLNKPASHRPIDPPARRTPVDGQEYYPPSRVKRNNTAPIVLGIVIGLIVLIPVVVIGLGIVGAIAVPNLLASRKAANESAVVSRLRTFHAVQSTYQSTGGAGAFGSFEDLIKADLLGELPRGFGYEYRMTRSADAARYCLAANPAVTNRAQKQRSAAVSSDGVIYVSETTEITCENGTLGGGGMQRME